MIQVLFVCLGNICRSPTAEGVFRELVRREDLGDAIRTDSCGTSDWHIGEAPDTRARAEAKRRGVDLDDLRGRQIAAADFAAFDYIMAMDNNNLTKLQTLAPASLAPKISLFLDFAPGLDLREVPDPYYGGDNGFSDVFDMIESASRGLLAHIRTNHPEIGA